MKNPGIEKFPIGAWCTMTSAHAEADQPKDWKELHFTLGMTPTYVPGENNYAHFRKILDSTLENGMKCILCDERVEARNILKEGLESFRKGIEETYKDFGDHSAIWGVHIGDEPLRDEEQEAFYQAISVIREKCPGWEPYCNLLPWHQAGEDFMKKKWEDYLDEFIKKSGMNYISYDCYTQMNYGYPNGTDDYFKNLRLYGNATKKHGIPFWNIILSVPHFTYKQPTLDDIRWQFNTSIACGAKGIFWFYVYQQQLWRSNYRNAPVNKLGRKTESYYWLADVDEAFERTLAPYICSLEFDKVNFVGQAYGGFTLFTEDDTLGPQDNANRLLISYFHDENGTKYVLVVSNERERDFVYNLNLKGTDHKIEELVCDGEWRKCVGNLNDDGPVVEKDGYTFVPHWYAPGQAVFYRIDAK